MIVPAFYNFPHAAKMLSLSFVLFAAWYSETALGVAEYPRLAAAGIVSLFGSINVSLPFLLDFARVPADTFQLFVATGVLNSRFGTLAAAMHMVVLALAGTYALTGRLRLSGKGLLRYVLVTAGLTAATLAGVGLTLRALGGSTYEGARLASELGLLRPPSDGTTVLAELAAEVFTPPAEGGRLDLESVRARGRVRVGFIRGQAPYSHFNARGELVGFDVEMAHALARELGVAVEFAPVPRADLVDVLEKGRVDVVMAGVLLTTQRASRVEFSTPYLDEVLAFVVPDHRRAEFSDAARVRATPGLRIGVPDPALRAADRGARVPERDDRAHAARRHRGLVRRPGSAGAPRRPLPDRGAGLLHHPPLPRLVGGGAAPGGRPPAPRLPRGPARPRDGPVPRPLDRAEAPGRHDPGPLRPLDSREGREGPPAALVDPARRAGLGGL